MQWKRVHLSSFELVSLAVLWLFPAVVAFVQQFPRFLVIWAVFSVFTGIIVREANKRQIHGSTPRRVYTFFLVGYRICYALAVLGYIMIMLDFMGISSIFTGHAHHHQGRGGHPLHQRGLGESSQPTGDGASFSQEEADARAAKEAAEHLAHAQSHYPLTATGFLLIFYGLYFGVLGRDLASLCASRMAATIGYSSHDGRPPSNMLGNNTCAICNNPLYANLVQQFVADEAGNVRPAPPKQEEEQVFTLTCGHAFHDFCIRGWLLIGKKSTCAYCCEKVNVSQTLIKTPWESVQAGVAWSALLDFIRFSIVFYPAMIALANAALLVLY